METNSQIPIKVVKKLLNSYGQEVDQTSIEEATNGPNNSGNNGTGNNNSNNNNNGEGEYH